MRILTFLFITMCSIMVHAQIIELLKFDDLHSKVLVHDDIVYVLNFWATWCKPCIQELPYFEECNVAFKDEKLKIILVNLDFNSKVSAVAEPFIKKNKIHSSVKHILDTDPNTWINRIDESWSGAIPATIIYKNKQKIFFKEGSLTLEELKEALSNALKPPKR